MVYRQFDCQRLNFLLRLTFGTLINSLLLLLLLLFCACKNREHEFKNIKCTVKSKESHSASLSEFLSLQCSFDDLAITLICHLCSYTTATPVTMPTTTPAPMDQYIALQSLASKTVAAAQTGRMASLVNLDILSVEVTDPEPPRELPKGWKRATPEDGNYSV